MIRFKITVAEWVEDEEDQAAAYLSLDVDYGNEPAKLEIDAPDWFKGWVHYQLGFRPFADDVVISPNHLHEVLQSESMRTHRPLIIEGDDVLSRSKPPMSGTPDEVRDTLAITTVYVLWSMRTWRQTGVYNGHILARVVLGIPPGWHYWVTTQHDLAAAFDSFGAALRRELESELAGEFVDHRPDAGLVALFDSHENSVLARVTVELLLAAADAIERAIDENPTGPGSVVAEETLAKWRDRVAELRPLTSELPIND